MASEDGAPRQPAHDRADHPGSPRDCVDVLQRAPELGLDKVGFTIGSLPREVEARIDSMRMIVEEILRPLGALT